jgi:Tol biopolymer transport system component/DNA-binding winged helix-turn-helix (wHTH) protein
MNKVPRNLGASRPIDIGAEADFSIGGLAIHPSTREVSASERRETVEPRVMQVLVALVRADGGVLSRDRLIEQCWGGRLVGDDAINSSVAKVRSLAALTMPPAFEIETIPRVGYRLHTRDSVTRAADALRATESSRVQEPRRLPVWSWIAIAGACVVVLIAGLAWWFFRPNASLDWVVVESHQPFIGTPLIERYPALSPDGTMLAYSAGTNLTNRQIFLRIVKGDSSLQLTHETFDATSPAWSPDGTTLAYAVFQDGHPCRIMEMDIPAGAPHQVGSCRSAERIELTFDPSGQALVFADNAAPGAPTHLVRFDVESGHVTPITDPPKTTLGDDDASFSPDGGYVSYVRDLGGVRSEIRLRRLADGTESILDKFNGCDAAPAWTPDGRAVLVWRNCLGSYSLWAYSPDGRKTRQIFSSANGIERLSVNPNGYVAMETFGGHAPIMAFKPGSNLPPTPLDGASSLTSNCADFAPDGALAITGSMNSNFGVFIASHEGAPFRKLISLPQFACAIRWSPDGTRFAFIETAPGGFRIPIVSREGETVSRIDYAATETGLFDWTADGKSILSTRMEKDGWRIWRTDLAAPNKSWPISPFGWIDPRVHGKMLFAEKYGVVGTWRLDIGAPARISNGPTLQSSDLMTISGDQLYFADFSDPKHPDIAAQSVYGGAEKRVMSLPFGMVNFTFAVNPRSGDIVFSPPAAENADIGLVRLQRR